MENQLLLDNAFMLDKQCSLHRLEMQNWGGYGETVIMHIDGKNSVVIGKNGVGKTTALHAFNTIFKQPRTGYTNIDKEGKKSSRSEKDYVRNVYGEKTTGRLESRADISFDAVLLLCLKQGENNYYTLGVVIEHKATSTNLSRTYFTARKNMSIDVDIAPILDMESQAKGFADMEIKTYRSYQDYITDVSDFLNTNKKIFELIEQFSTIKNISNLDVLFKEYILEAFMLSESEKANSNADIIETSSTQLLEGIEKHQISISLATYKEKFEKLAKSKITLQNQKEELEEERKLFKSWQINLKIDAAAKEIQSSEKANKNFEEENTKLEKTKTSLENEITLLERSRDNTLQNLENEIAALKNEHSNKKEKYFDFTSKVERLGYEKVKIESEVQHQQTIESLLYKREDCLTLQDKALSEKGVLEQTNIKLKSEKENIEKELLIAKEQKNSIGVPYTSYRSILAKHLEVTIESIPFVGEIIKLTDFELAKHYVDLGRTLIIPKDKYNKALYFLDTLNIETNINFISSDYTNTQLSSQNMPEYKLNEESSFKKAALELLKEYVASMPFVNSSYNGASDTLFKSGLFSKNVASKKLVFQGLSVFGWDNKLYIKNLEEELANKVRLIGKNNGEIETLQLTIDETRNLVAIIDEVKMCKFSEIDFLSVVIKIKETEDRYNAEKKGVEEKNRVIDETIADKRNEMKSKELSIRSNVQKIGVNQKTITNNKEVLEQYPNRFDIPKQKEVKFISNSHLDDKYYEDELSSCKLNLERNNSTFEKEKVVFISKFKQICYQEKLSEQDNSIMLYLQNKESDTFETRKLYSEQLFRTYPNVVNSYFQTLKDTAETIINEIDKINNSLKNIEFNSGSYLQVIAKKVKDKKLENYLGIKKSVEEHIDLISKTEKSEDKERFIYELRDNFIKPFVSKEKEHQEEREKWSKVSNWFDFSIIEYAAIDDSEIRYYRDLSSVSGGEKETIGIALLAAILSFNSSKGLKNSFASVFIDEAFSSVDNSDKIDNMLTMLTKLGIQFVVITPYTHLSSIQNHVERAFEVLKVSEHSAIIYQCDFETIEDHKRVMVVGDTHAKDAEYQTDI